VHTLYERVGLHYDYATSRALYRGLQEFRRVSEPRPGDLIVWRGHASARSIAIALTPKTSLATAASLMLHCSSNR